MALADRVPEILLPHLLWTGSRLREIREAGGHPAEEVASRAGIRRSTIVRIESGHVAPTLETLVRIAMALDVSPRELVTDARFQDG